MSMRIRRRGAWLLACAVTVAFTGACGSEEAGPPAASTQAAAPSAAATPDELPQALVLALAQFLPKSETGGKTVPGPARLEFLVRKGGRWTMTYLEDAQSNVFHKAMSYSQGARPRLLTAAGTEATIKLWTKGEDGKLTARTLWQKDFGGKYSRMRDVEVADLFADGTAVMAVATHDQGIVATIVPGEGASFEVTEIDLEPDTFVHEIEIGDVDGDGVLEVYATPSEPNRLDGSVQTGQVVRYVPAKGEGRVVVADLGDRHAKEIYVDDLDGNGSDELYVVVEGTTAPGTRNLEKGVEVRRYEAGTDPKQTTHIASIDDRLARFLTGGDVDGDGVKELVLAGFSSGVWLLRPGADPRAQWQIQSIDRDSGGFEHATVVADLDGDGADEIYVASDKHKELRRYVWDGSGFAREVIYERPDDRSIFTWNVMPVPVELVPAADQPAD